MACQPLFPAILALAMATVALPATPSDYAVQAQAATQASPPTVTLTWLHVPGGTGYSVNRRTWSSPAGFTSVATGLPATASTWSDGAVSVGISYEYQVVRAAGANHGKDPTSYGYVAVGIDLPLVDQRGTVALLVDDTQAAPLAAELAGLQADLAGDGWKVIRHDVARSTAIYGKSPSYETGCESDRDQTAVPAIRAKLVADATADPALSHVLIIGDIPIPYAGLMTVDGHGQHLGAWPADVYYGDLDGVWTDTTVNCAYKQQPGGDNSANLIGDGRFDQNEIPGKGRQLAVGRIDLARMSAFRPATETDLLRRYLVKAHAWRSGQWTVPTTCLVDDDTWKDLPGWGAPGVNGWLTASTVGLGNVVQGDWMTLLPTTGFLFAEGCGWGSPSSCAGVTTTKDLVDKPMLGVFTMLNGSYLVDWNRGNDLMRAILANEGHGLTCTPAGRPNMHHHRMALGATIGDCWRLTQDVNWNRYPPIGGCAHSPHMGLMGDPTLRAHPIIPPGSPVATASGGKTVLRWSASPNAGVVGYHVYRASSPNGPFERISGSAASVGNPAGSPVIGLTWTDPATPTGPHAYLIKAIVRQVTPGGSYYHASLGARVTR